MVYHSVYHEYAYISARERDFVPRFCFTWAVVLSSGRERASRLL